MKIGIMQPYFFPYLGYFSLIKHTDQFVLFDTAQFIRHGWIERNRILKPLEGWQYIQVPLQKHHQTTLIKDIAINNSIHWQEKILAQLQHYKKKAPYYYSTIKLIKDIFSYDNFSDIVSLNRIVLEKTMDYLGVKTEIKQFSTMGLSIEPAHAPDEWALNICMALGNITAYWNPTGGKQFFDVTKYTKSGIDLKFHSVNLTEYDQKRPCFEQGLSIIDVMMFNDIQAINEMLDNYKLD